MAAVKIRAVNPADIETICALAVRAWAGIHAGYRKYVGNDDLYHRISAGWREDKARAIRGKARKQPEEVLVAELDGKPAGFITFKLNRNTGIGEICNNAVDPDCQGQGIGSRLYRAALDIFRAQNMQYAIVSTGFEDEGHAAARAAYEKVGFKKMRTSVTYSLKL